MSDIYRGGTLIVPLEQIKIDGNNYIFQEGDKIIFAIKAYSDDCEAILKKEASPKAGEASVQVVFTAEDTEKLTGKNYVLQADLINSSGVFPMPLDELNVIGCAIKSEEGG